MPKRKMKRVYIDGDGVEHNLELIEVKMGKDSLENLVEAALTAEEDDMKIKVKSVEVRKIIERTSGRKDTLKRWYELGRVLQFVDDLKLEGENSRREAFRRLFKDLQVDTRRHPSVEKVTRYPEHMYNLSKIPEKLVFHKGMTWSRWFDILEYKAVWRKPEPREKRVKEWCGKGWDGRRLRRELQILNKRLKANPRAAS
jgi:hypothetical protein